MGTGCVEKQVAKTINYVDFVDPIIGTDFHGHTFPGQRYPVEWFN